MAIKKTPDNKLVSSIYDKFKRFTDRMEALHESPYPHVSLSPSEHEAQNRALKRELTKEAKDADQGRGFKKSQSDKARHRRGKLSESDENIVDLIERLATSTEQSSLSAKELWPRLIGELDSMQCEPKDIGNALNYDSAGGVRKRLSLKRFTNAVSKARAK